MDYRIEAITLPVADVDRAKAFYEQAGWHLDVDTEPAPGMRVVQLTPPRSDCSITFGIGMGEQSEPGSYRATYLVVSDIFHYGPEGRVPGPDPEHRDYWSYATFADPDGNTWLLQEVPSRASGAATPG